MLSRKQRTCVRVVDLLTVRVVVHLAFGHYIALFLKLVNNRIMVNRVSVVLDVGLSNVLFSTAFLH